MVQLAHDQRGRQDQGIVVEWECFDASPRVFCSDHGVPVFWQEKKPTAFWEDIVIMLDAKLVVDLSPGSGALGRACLRQSVPYVVVCATEGHRAWLGNALDQEACELITKNESPLFETDLSEMIKTHYQDVLEVMVEMQREPDSGSHDDEDEQQS